jgi:hypothetical protein
MPRPSQKRSEAATLPNSASSRKFTSATPQVALTVSRRQQIHNCFAKIALKKGGLFMRINPPID